MFVLVPMGIPNGEHHSPSPAAQELLEKRRKEFLKPYIGLLKGKIEAFIGPLYETINSLEADMIGQNAMIEILGEVLTDTNGSTTKELMAFANGRALASLTIYQGDPQWNLTREESLIGAQHQISIRTDIEGTERMYISEIERGWEVMIREVRPRDKAMIDRVLTEMHFKREEIPGLLL